MRVFIVEDERGVISVLEDIIEDNGLGEVCGTNEGRAVSAGQILSAAPDLVLVDFLMPEKDGVQVVRELKEAGCRAKLVMLSQVSDKELVAKAYSEGIDFFVSKPINIVEIRSVLERVERELTNERTIENIRQLFEKQPEPQPAARPEETLEAKLRTILTRIGMAGEKGTDDIVTLCLELDRKGQSIGSAGIGTLCRELSPQPKTMEQRIRRAIGVGLSNIAHLGLEDVMNETFSRYGSVLFSFEEVRAEMNRIREKTENGGKTNIRKFVDGLMQEARR